MRKRYFRKQDEGVPAEDIPAEDGGWVSTSETTWEKEGVIIMLTDIGFDVVDPDGGVIGSAGTLEEAQVIGDEFLGAEVAPAPETEMAAASYRQSAPYQRGPRTTRPHYQTKQVPIQRMPAQKAIAPEVDIPYMLRFGNESAAQKRIMTDMFGTGYRQTLYDQEMAFTKYLRGGDNNLNGKDKKLLMTQVFPAKGIMHLIGQGMSVKSVKATMVEAQGSLGGYAVPPQIQSNIITRIPGLTVVRGGGGMVLTLTDTNSTEIIEYTGGDERYVGALRGLWGAEAADPTADNATLGMVQIAANIYTYKVVMSQSLVEDAINLVDLLQTDIANVLAIDEDEAFLIGDGIGKPTGLLPGGVNTFALTEANIGDANLMTAAGLKTLKRSIQSQYRGAAAWIGNSDTYSDIEQLTDDDGRFMFEDLSEADTLLAKTARESEAMPDVAAGAYPMLFADLSGYYIIERLGLTIVRFQDSATGINRVEFHVRRRVGGRIAEPWKFAVQKVSA